jgi:7-carboxy-7-deazaguanine synthase
MKLARLDDGPEIFLSLQGEGKNQGAPSVFVRTSRCNLYCTWCDTPYTWNWRGSEFAHLDARQYDRERETLELGVLEIAQRVQHWQCRRVVLTGGEPLLQAPDCAALARTLRALDSRYQIEIETNGTIAPSAELDAAVQQYTVSPKLEHSRVERSLRLRPAVLAAFAENPRSVFKFVLSGAADVAAVCELVREHGIDADRVYLMPLGTSAEDLGARRPPIAQACLDHGYRFSDRLHIHLYGNRPGV